MLRLAQQAGNLTGREIVGLPCKAGREAGLLAEFFLQGRLRDVAAVDERLDAD
jgi:hypothetical protein